ncbi:hypothetical protein BH23GEM3_BH23GEM3_12600 [soil metagenome]|nr:hypothetical protein [Gemmatimonadota bacterium]
MTPAQDPMIMNPRQRTCWLAVLLVCVLAAACTAPPGPGNVAGSASVPVGATAAAGLPHDPPTRTQVLWGRQLVITHDCAGCHGGGHPAADGWLAGVRSTEQRPHATPFEREFEIGPFMTDPRYLKPDNATGVGRFSERQIFNALRYGLRPGETPDVEITSAVPGQGNHPAHPKYLAPPMPWPAYRHLADDEIRAIASYLRNGVRPVSNRVPDSEGPQDFWGTEYTPDKIGMLPAPAFPTSRERQFW